MNQSPLDKRIIYDGRSVVTEVVLPSGESVQATIFSGVRDGVTPVLKAERLEDGKRIMYFHPWSTGFEKYSSLLNKTDTPNVQITH